MASRCLRDLGLLADGGITNMVTAAAAACIAALGSWRLLNLASRFLRNSATQHRIAEAKVYGPFHSLDATMKPPVDEGKDSDTDTRGPSKRNKNKKGTLSSRSNSGSLNSTKTSADGLSNGRGQQNRSGPRVPEIELNGSKESGLTSGKFTPAEKSRGGGLRGRNSSKGANRHPGAPNNGAPGDFEEPFSARIRI